MHWNGLCSLRAMQIAGMTFLKMAALYKTLVVVLYVGMIHRITLGSNLTLQRVLTSQHKCFQYGSGGCNPKLFWRLLLQFACLYSLDLRFQVKMWNSAVHAWTAVTAGSALGSAFIFLHPAAHSPRMTDTHQNIVPV